MDTTELPDFATLRRRHIQGNDPPHGIVYSGEPEESESKNGAVEIIQEALKR